MSGAEYRWPVRVYYEDTDFSGVVYHAGYLRFLERGRTELLRAAGISQSALQVDEGLGAFAVRAMTIEFVAPARMDDELTVVSLVEEIGGASVAMRQRIERDGATLVTATVRIGLVAAGKARRLPPALRDRLAATAARIGET